MTVFHLKLTLVPSSSTYIFAEDGLRKNRKLKDDFCLDLLIYKNIGAKQMCTVKGVTEAHADQRDQISQIKLGIPSRTPIHYTCIGLLYTYIFMYNVKCR